MGGIHFFDASLGDMRENPSGTFMAKLCLRQRLICFDSQLFRPKKTGDGVQKSKQFLLPGRPDDFGKESPKM
jgi:hypothetical protein